jgi:hypothetical protein
MNWMPKKRIINNKAEKVKEKEKFPTVTVKIVLYCKFQKPREQIFGIVLLYIRVIEYYFISTLQSKAEVLIDRCISIILSIQLV